MASTKDTSTKDTSSKDSGSKDVGSKDHTPSKDAASKDDISAKDTSTPAIDQGPVVDQKVVIEEPSLKLGALFDKYGSDKHRNGYTPIYQSLFKNIRERELNILEIGIGTMISGAPSSMVGYSLPNYQPGGSLRAWRDYFPKSHIWGLDIQPDTQFSEERISTDLVNSINATAVDAFFAKYKDIKFDIIIDDGWHKDSAQLATLRNFLPHVKKGGYYIVEDIYPKSKFLTIFKAEVELISVGWHKFVTEDKNICVFSS